jgi:hypothetical protein
MEGITTNTILENSVRLTSAGDNGEGEKREGTLGIVVVSRARKS